MGTDPQEAGARLQGLLLELCPKLAPGNSPRGYHMDREALLDKCETPSQRSQLESAIATSASGGKCGMCRKHPVTEDSAGIIVTWNADFKKLQWSARSATAACLHCCTSSSVDEMLRAMVSAPTAQGGESAFAQLAEHSIFTNGMQDAAALQAALNTAHAIKTLASNLQFKVVDAASGKPILPKDLPGIVTGILGGEGGGEKPAARSRKSTGGIPEGKKKGAGDGETPSKKKSRKSMA